MLSFLDNIKTMVSENGLAIDQYKDALLKRKVCSRMRANKIDSFKDYIELLDGNREEMEMLMESLSINVTRFFRDNSTFTLFRSRVLPSILRDKERENKKFIRIWSAGCSTGEEPYSLAMITRGISKRFLVSITATDIDRLAIVKARLGEYQKKEIKNIEKQYLRFFDYDNGTYKLRHDVKSMVRFLQHDILSGRYYRFFDAIFCRNLLIYLSRNAQNDVLKRMHGSLNTGGFLILGKTEIMPKEFSSMFVLNDLKERVYRKI